MTHLVSDTVFVTVVLKMLQLVKVKVVFTDGSVLGRKATQPPEGVSEQGERRSEGTDARDERRNS